MYSFTDLHIYNMHIYIMRVEIYTHILNDAL
jgi:hypothetical protein